MNELADAYAKTLQAALDGASSPKAVKRLMIALAYADDVRVETLSERYDIPRATVYSWLDRFDSRLAKPLKSSLGRVAQRNSTLCSERLSDGLAGSPAELEYDVSGWKPTIVQSHIGQTYGVSYSLGHVRRLLRELPTST